MAVELSRLTRVEQQHRGRDDPLPEIAAAAVASQRRHEEQIVALLLRHCRRLDIHPALPLPQAVVLLSALNPGLALRRHEDES